MLIKKASTKRMPRPRQYHGHTIIELHNHRSGSRERIESDNEFTDGIGHYLRSGGTYNNSPWANSNWKAKALYRNLIGGLMLFDKSIEKVNGKYPTIMPAGTRMIANASYGVTNNGNPTEMGSFNASESSFNANALTFVYDWTTSQGNGDIACACLTSDVGGYIGMGNSTSQVAHSTTKDIFENQASSADSLSFGAYSSKIEVVGDKIYQIGVDSTTNRKFTIMWKPAQLNSVNLFSVTFSADVTIPNTVCPSASTIYLQMFGGRIVANTGSVRSDQMYTWGIYDILTGEWSLLEFTSPMTISFSYLYGGTDYIYVHNSTNQNGLIIKSDGTTQIATMGQKYWYMTEGVSLSIQYAGGNNRNLYICDDVNGTRYVTNGYKSEYSTSFNIDFQNGQMLVSAYGNPSVIYCYRNPLYLATVNNLDESVQKTASQTMKVTYIVTPE